MRNQAFTLLEFIIALAIFAIIGVGALTGLRYALDANENISEIVKLHHELAITHQRLKQDLLQVIMRPDLDIDDNLLSPFIGAKQIYQDINQTDPSSQFILAFSRTSSLEGLDGVIQNSSAMLRVEYFVEQGTLFRRVWPISSFGVSPRVYTQSLLSGLKDISIFFINDQGLEVNEWQVMIPGANNISNSQAQLPLAVIIELRLDNSYVLDWLFELTPGEYNVQEA